MHPVHVTDLPKQITEGVFRDIHSGHCETCSGVRIIAVW